MVGLVAWRHGDKPPFEEVALGPDLAKWFWSLEDRRNRGAEGLDLWRDDRDYQYLWVEAMTDHDYYEGYLLDVRTSIGDEPFNETRQFLYLFAGVGPTFETEWHDLKVRFDAPHEEHHERLRDGLHWFAERVLASLGDLR